MARGVPEANTGTIPAAVSGVREEFYTTIIDELAAYQSNSTDAWEVWDTVDATLGQRDIVYMSKGDRTLVGPGEGDARIYVRIQRRPDPSLGLPEINFTMYQYWEPGAAGYNATEYLWGETSLMSHPGGITDLNDTDLVDWWRASNEYEFFFIANQGSKWMWVHFGQPDRAFVAPSYSGVCFTTGAETAGATVTVALDRDLGTTVTDGQKLWIADVQGGTGDVEIVTMTSYNAGGPDMVIANLVNDYAAGAIIGWDPQPLVVAASSDDATFAATGREWQTITKTDAAGSGNPSSGNIFMQDMGLMIPGTQWDEGQQDPGLDSLYTGTRVMLHHTITLWPRGVFDLRSYWAEGGQADGDIMLEDGQTSKSWRVFTSLATTYSTILGIGGGPP